MSVIYGKCGMRCDMCYIYRPNVQKQDLRGEVCRVWKKQNPSFDADQNTIICDGCACEDPEAVCFDKECRTRKCVIEKGIDHCGYCKNFPCESYPAEPSPQEIVRMVEVDKIWSWEDEKYMAAYSCKKFMEEFRKENGIE